MSDTVSDEIGQARRSLDKGDPSAWSPAIRAIEARGYRKAIDLLRRDGQEAAAAYLEAMEGDDR